MNDIQREAKRPQVLLLEDDALQASLIRKRLELAAFQVTVCQDVETGLRHSEQQSFAVAVVDLDLGEQSGLDFVRGLVRTRSQMNVILHSVDSTFASVKEGLNLGVFAYVEKGRNDNQLIDYCHRAAAAYLSDNLDAANEAITFQLRLLDAVDHGIIATDANGKVIYWNRFSEHLTGLSPLQVLGNSIFDFVLLSEADRQDIDLQIQSGGNWQGECQFYQNATQSNRIFVRLAISVLRDSNGRHIGSVISHHDLSGVKVNEKRLKRRAKLLNINSELGRIAVEIADRNTFLRQVLKKIDEGLSLNSGRVLLANPTWATMKSFASVGRDSRAGLGNIHLTDVDQLQFQVSIDGFRMPLFENGELVGCIEGEFKKPRILGPEKKDFLQSVSSLIKGVLLRNWANQMRQRSERLISEQQEQLAHFQRTATMGQMAAVLAHEINQPLGAISNFSGGLLYGLKKSCSLDSELSDTLELIHGEAIKAGSIVNRLRKFITRDPFNMKRIDLNSSIQDTIKILKNLLSNANIDIRLELDSSLPFVQADPIRIQQVLVNVIKNSAEAIRMNAINERFVKLATNTMDNWIQICISDNGPALAHSDFANLFKPYHTTKSNGLGMGLCISRTIVEQHDGTMSMTQRIPKGMLTTIRIPSF